jgi:hypothetical protein
MLAKQRPGWLAGFVNVDGNLTEADCSLISAPAATAIDFEGVGNWIMREAEQDFISV